MKAVIYARYSSDNQREASIEGQIRECTAFAEKNGITVLRHYIDRAISAKTDNRPEFQNMIIDSNKKLFDMIIVWKLDRFARNRYDSARYKAQLKKNGVKVVSATEVISDGAEGIILESMLEGFAEYYSVDLSEKVVRGMTDNALKCMFNGGTLPMGYVIDAEQHFQIDPVTAPYILDAFKQYDEGATMTQIRDWLNEQGMKNTRGNPLTYNSVQHLLFCGYCGAYLCGESGTSRTGVVHHYYKCVSVKKKRKECHKKPVKKGWIEDLVVSETMKMIMDDDAIEAIVSMLMELQEQDNTNIPLYERQLQETNTKIRNLINAIQQGVLTKSTKESLEELEAAKEELETRLANEQLSKPPKISAEFMTFWLHRFRKLDVTKQSHRKMLIDTFINAIYLYDDKMLITFNYKDRTKKITFSEIQEASKRDASGSDLECSPAPKRRHSAECLLFFLHCKNTTTNIKEESTVLQLESERLTYREITEQDFEIVAGILRDPEVRRIWEQDFSDEEVWAWIARRQEGYRKSGIDYLLALDKATGQPVGQIGVLREEINGEKIWGVGYILRSDCRKKGYATEGARRMAAYAFEELGADKIICDIRPINGPSLAVARRLHMTETGSFVKLVHGVEMVHQIFVLRPEDLLQK